MTAFSLVIVQPVSRGLTRCQASYKLKFLNPRTEHEEVSTRCTVCSFRGVLLMKKKTMVIVTALCLLWAAIPWASGESITLVADEWPPFNNIPGSGQEGYMVDIAREVYARHGIQVVYEIVPWKRAIAGTRSGTYHGAIGASKTDARGFIFPEEELSRNVLSFYVKKGNPWRFQTQASIASVTLGVASGYDYRRWLNDYIATHRGDSLKVQVMNGGNPLENNLKKMLHGRIDVVVDNEASIRYVAKAMGILDEIQAAGYGNEPAYIYIAFSPNDSASSRYARLLSEGIVQLRDEGRLDIILQKYGLTDWK